MRHLGIFNKKRPFNCPMTNVITQIKMKKILSASTVAGISLMLFASIFSAMPTSSASADPCEVEFGGGVIVFDSKHVLDTDTGDWITVYKCYMPSIDCTNNDPNPANNIEEVPKKSDQSSTCVGFGVIMFTNADNAVLTDSVPAEWDTIGFTDVSGTCTEEVKGNNQQGATVYTCDEDSGFAAFSVAFLETRESPSNGKNENNPKPDKYKPTSCEIYKNEGAEGFVLDATFTNGWLDGNQIIDTETPFSTGLTDQLPVTVVGPGC